jgi:hypothetical protein
MVFAIVQAVNTERSLSCYLVGQKVVVGLRKDDTAIVGNEMVRDDAVDTDGTSTVI